MALCGSCVEDDPDNTTTPSSASISLHQCLTCDATKQWLLAGTNGTLWWPQWHHPFHKTLHQCTLRSCFMRPTKVKNTNIEKYKNTKQKRNHKSYRNKINAQYQKYKMLRTTRVLIAVVFSAPPTSPLSQRWSTEMSNPLYLVERAVQKMWYFNTQSYILCK